MPFSYPWTCKEIDSNITIILDNIRDHLVDEYTKNYQLDVYELTPDMQSEIEIEAQVLYCNIRDHIEAIRLTNSDIRTAAEDQVKQLEDALQQERDENIAYVKELNDTINELELVIRRDGYSKDGKEK